jgi:hypothetical protein
MSRADVELVRSLLPPPGVDLAAVVRDDELVRGYLDHAAPHIDPAFECVADWGGECTSYHGLDGLRSLFLDWTAPWTTYHSEAERFEDLGDRVLVLVRDSGRRADSDREVAILAGSVWSFSAGKILRAEFYARRDEALLSAAGPGR